MEHRTDIRWNQRPIVMESAMISERRDQDAENDGRRLAKFRGEDEG